MIRKYLIFGKQVYLSSIRREIPSEEELPSGIEVRVPLDVLWKGQDILKHAEYLQSIGEEQSRILDTYKTLLKLMAPYAVLEKDRLWLYEQLK